MQRIDGSFNLTPGSNLSASQDNQKNKELSFGDIFQENINKVNNLNKEADQLAEKLALGEVDNIHEVTIAAEKARTAINLTSAIQSKVVQSYEEIMRMQV